MLILPSEGVAGTSRIRLMQRAPWVAALLLFAALTGWFTVGWRAQPAHLPAVDAQSVAADTADAPSALARRATDAQPDAVLGFLASAAKEAGVTWVSVQVGEAPRVSPNDPQRLDVWQAQVSLQGSYPAVKRWLREAVGRYPNLVLQTARWARASGGGPVVAGGADALDVQLQLVWLQRPAAPHPQAAAAAGDRQASRR
jgi:hypothetical protein